MQIKFRDLLIVKYALEEEKVNIGLNKVETK